MHDYVSLMSFQQIHFKQQATTNHRLHTQKKTKTKTHATDQQQTFIIQMYVCSVTE
jgi:hypothetical protein